MHVNRMYVGVN